MVEKKEKKKNKVEGGNNDSINSKKKKKDKKKKKNLICLHLNLSKFSSHNNIVIPGLPAAALHQTSLLILSSNTKRIRLIPQLETRMLHCSPHFQQHDTNEKE